MKKITFIIIGLLLCIGLNAQNDRCNRLLIHQDEEKDVYIMEKIDSLSFGAFENDLILHQGNNKTEFILENIDSLSFEYIRGDVAAKVNIIDYTTNSVTADITRTESCVEYKMSCVEYNSIASMSDDDIAKNINENVTTSYSQDFTGVEITDLELKYNTEYAIVTVGIDKYGLLCKVTKERFLTPVEELSGKPKVDVDVVENNYYDFTVEFTPNADVSKYSVILGEAGSIEKQYRMFSHAYGWNSIGEMIEDWGLEFNKTESYQWKDKAPNLDYEIFIQARDANGVMAPYKVFKFKSKSMGGEGIAQVEIKLGPYELNDWYGEMLPSQFLTFIPNDQTSAYAVGVYLAENYNTDPDGYHDDLFIEPSMPTPGWFQHNLLTTDYQIDPGTECVAIAAAKNINNEWGPVTVLFFTTPDEMPSKTATNKSRRIK